MSEKKTNTPKRTSKQIVALIGVILLAALYVVTLLVAIFNPDGAGMLLRGCLAATVVVPLLIWGYILLYGLLTGHHTIADLDILKNSENE